MEIKQQSPLPSESKADFTLLFCQLNYDIVLANIVDNML